MTMPMTYVKPDAARGRTQGYFVAAHDFTGADKNAMKATFTVEGLAKKPVEFKSAISLAEPTVYACPMHSDVMGEDPGKCGKCGMNLEKMGGHEEHDSETGKAFRERPPRRMSRFGRVATPAVLALIVAVALISGPWGTSTDRMRSVPPAPGIPGDPRKGERLFRKLDCIRCHSEPRAVGGINVPPPLSLAGSRANTAWTVEYLLDPYPLRYRTEGALPDLRMPRATLSRDDAVDLAAFLAGQIDSVLVPGWSPPTVGATADSLAIEGRRLFRQYQCLGCHELARRRTTDRPRARRSQHQEAARVRSGSPSRPAAHHSGHIHEGLRSLGGGGGRPRSLPRHVDPRGSTRVRRSLSHAGSTA